jgi:pilus assembly protein CpaE
LAARRGQYVGLIEIEEQARWLESALASDSALVITDEYTVERVLQLVDSASASLLFVRFGAADFLARAKLVQRLLDRKPNLSVIAVAERDDRELVLAALRAGAHDFVPVGAPAVEVREAVERVLARRSPQESASASGCIHALLSARPDGATASLAVHLALAFQRLLGSDARILLLDAGAPVGDTLLFLDLRPSFSFADAVRSVRRFDQTLIQAAFARHASGLSVLTLPENPSELEDIETADAVALTGVLRAYFDHVVVNLSGFFNLEFLLPVVQRADQVLVHADQCVASCRANYRLIESIRREKIELNDTTLVIDRFQPKAEPTGEQVSELLGISSFVTIPAEGAAMVQAMNRGKTIFDLVPRSAYLRAVTGLAANLLDLKIEEENPARRAWQRLTGKKA